MARKSKLVTGLYAWNDILWMFVVVMLIFFNEENKKAQEADTKAGAISIYTEWEHGADLDVDVWVEYPASKLPLYYNRLQSTNGWIGRDDKGVSNSDSNSENVALYDLEPGDYTVNVHAFRQGQGSTFPTKVKVTVTYVTPLGARSEIFDSTVELKNVKQEITVVRWRINGDDKVENVNHVYKNLVNTKNTEGRSNVEAHE